MEELKKLIWRTVSNIKYLNGNVDITKDFLYFR